MDIFGLSVARSRGITHGGGGNWGNVSPQKFELGGTQYTLSPPPKKKKKKKIMVKYHTPTMTDQGKFNCYPIKRAQTSKIFWGGSQRPPHPPAEQARFTRHLSHCPPPTFWNQLHPWPKRIDEQELIEGVGVLSLTLGALKPIAV